MFSKWISLLLQTFLFYPKVSCQKNRSVLFGLTVFNRVRAGVACRVLCFSVFVCAQRELPPQRERLFLLF